MSQRENNTCHDTLKSEQSSTESSQCTESTESRMSYTAPPRQTSRALLEKRRQDLPKASSLEQAYLRNSRKQVYYHPVQQQQQQHISDNILKAIKTTHSYRIQQLENQVAADQIKINEYLTEIRTLKTQQKRLEIEIKKYQGMAGNIPNFMRVHEEDLRAVQSELKKTKRQCVLLNQTVASREEEMRKVKQENERWRKLEDLRQLEDRGKLHEQNEELKEEVARQNDKILLLTRKGMLEVKNVKHELANERKKHRETQQRLSTALANVEKLRTELDMKQKHLAYSSLRFSSHPRKMVRNGLESISLITLTGNRYGSVHNQVKLDPELSSRYPRLSVAKTRNNVDSSSVSNAPASNIESRTTVLSSQESLNNFPRKVSSNVSIRKSPPPIPLSDIQSDDDDDECSNLSEEDIDLYSSSNSRKDSLLSNSHVSAVGETNDLPEGSDTDSEAQTISHKSRRNGCSLPDLPSAEVGVEEHSCNGRQSQVSDEGGSQGERQLSEVSESYAGRRNSTESFKDVQRSSPAKSLKDSSCDLGNFERDALNAEIRNLISSQVMVTVSDSQVSSSENGVGLPALESHVEKSNALNNQQSNRSNGAFDMKVEGIIYDEKAEVHDEVDDNEKLGKKRTEYIKFQQELRQEIDEVSKGKLLAALDAIDKGKDPMLLEPFRGVPKEASIFTSTRTKSPTYEFNRMTEDLYRRPSVQGSRSPDSRVQVTTLDRFSSDSPSEHSKAKADLIKELFGVGKDVDVVAANRNIPFDSISFSDRNNNEPDGDSFHPDTRVSLTSWKH